MIKFNEFVKNTDINYVVENNIPLGELYRVGSENYYRLFREARELYKEGKILLDGPEKFMIEETDIGEFAEYQGRPVPLDSPLMEEEKQELGKPKRGGPKKFYVYVKDPSSGNIKKVTWGDTTGLKAKINNPEARKSFAARHRCDKQNDRTTAAYWACRLPYYAKQLGMSGGGSFFW